ncbi:MAG: threonine--tRNA ligase, partial [Firmicutes bacterium]|nr:threonine--tRNA ligase [Bacillota bacterium]
MTIIRQNTPFETAEEKKIFWETSSQIMAQALLRLYPDVKFAIGPAIDNGFYYDIDLGQRLTDADLSQIEDEMRRIVREDLPIVCRPVTRMEALGEAVAKNQPYKIEIINSLPQDVQLTFFDDGEFSDLRVGPLLERTSQVRAFKLMSIAGAYWRGSEKNKMLQRIYGISFPKPSMLDEYLQNLVEAKRRDHRKIGREMDLFMFPAEGPGFPLYLPKGMVIRNELMSFWKELHSEKKYNEIRTP